MSEYTGTLSLLSPSSNDKMGGSPSWKLRVPMGSRMQDLSPEMESDLFRHDEGTSLDKDPGYWTSG